jgi:hypothetical protein
LGIPTSHHHKKIVLKPTTRTKPRGHPWATARNLLLTVAQLLKDSSFIADLARFHESLLSEQFVRKKYGGLSEATWTQLGESDELVHAIELESIRRRSSGASKREKAQQHIVAAPDVLNGIMNDERASPRHRVDAIRTLDSMSATGPDAVPAADRFVICINIGNEKLVFGENVTPHGKKTIDHVDVVEHNTTDDDNDDDDGTPKWLPVVPNKQDRGGGGVPSW